MKYVCAGWFAKHRWLMSDLLESVQRTILYFDLHVNWSDRLRRCEYSTIRGEVCPSCSLLSSLDMVYKHSDRTVHHRMVSSQIAADK